MYYYLMKTINQLEKFDKPREKLLNKGAKSLKDYELVAILLGSGIKGKDVIKLSKEIVKLQKSVTLSHPKRFYLDT